MIGPSPQRSASRPRLSGTGGGWEVLAVGIAVRQASPSLPLRLRSCRALGEIPMMIRPPSPTNPARPRPSGTGGGVDRSRMPMSPAHRPSPRPLPPAPEQAGPRLPSISRPVGPGGDFFRRGRAEVGRSEIMMVGPLVSPTLRSRPATLWDRAHGDCGGGWGSDPQLAEFPAARLWLTRVFS